MSSEDADGRFQYNKPWLVTTYCWKVTDIRRMYIVWYIVLLFFFFFSPSSGAVCNLTSFGLVFNLASSGALFNLASFFHFRLGRWRPWRRWRQSTRHRQCEWGTSTPRPSPLLNSLRRNPSARRLLQSYVSFARTCLFVLYTECFLRDIIPFWVKIFPFFFSNNYNCKDNAIFHDSLLFLF